MSVFIIDSEKPEGQKAIQALIDLGKSIALAEKPVTDWVDPEQARLILGGGRKPISETYLKTLRDREVIKYSQLTEREYRYSQKSIEKFIESRSKA